MCVGVCGRCLCGLGVGGCAVLKCVWYIYKVLCMCVCLRCERVGVGVPGCYLA